MKEDIKNPKPIEEILNQAKKIEENNFSTIEYCNSINNMLNSNDLSESKDRDLTLKIKKLNRQMEDINRLTSELLNNLSSKNN